MKMFIIRSYNEHCKWTFLLYCFLARVVRQVHTNALVILFFLLMS